MKKMYLMHLEARRAMEVMMETKLRKDCDEIVYHHKGNISGTKSTKNKLCVMISRTVAHSLENHTFSKIVLSGHQVVIAFQFLFTLLQLAVTAVALSSDDRTVYSVSKDNSLIAWDIETSSKQVLIPKWRRSTHQDVQCHSGELLSVAVTSDGRYVACGGRDATVKIVDTRNNELIKSFTGHRDAITCMSFRKDSYSLFSGSLDRTVKHWDLNEMGYLETLFGHQVLANSSCKNHDNT